MQKISYRKERINELLKREIISVIRNNVKDKRLQEVSITEVIVSSDLTIAKIFFSTDEKNKKDTTLLLNKAAGFFRSQLSKKVDLRYTPALNFIYDTTINTSSRIEEILKNL